MALAGEIAREVADFYRGYIEAFNRADVEGYALWVMLPYALVSDQGLVVCANEDDHRQLAQRVFADLRSRGWHSTEVKFIKVWPFSHHQAMLMADVIRQRNDGSVLERGRFCYVVVRGAQGWRIVTFITVAAPFLGPCDLPR